MADDPTPDEIERVRAYEKRQNEARWRKRAQERDAKIEAHEQRVAEALTGGGTARSTATRHTERHASRGSGRASRTPRRATGSCC